MRTDRYVQEPKKHRFRALKIALLLIILLAAATAGYMYYSYNKTLDSLAVEFADDVVVEFGGEYPVMDYVNSAVGDVYVADSFLDADSVGDKALVFTVSQPMFGGMLTPMKEFTLRYKVVDTVKPLVLWSGGGTVVQTGTELDVRDLVAYGDNADPAPVLEIDGEVDTDTAGEYVVHATVTDASGNSTGWDIYIDVIDPPEEEEEEDEEEEEEPDRTQFKEFASAHAGHGTSFGIDVSSWQGDVDYKAVKAAGCDFVIIRIGYSSGGEVFIDNKFEQNFERAKAAGLKVGLYLYSYDNTTKAARASAKWIVEKLGGQSLDLPIAFDWEDFGWFQTYNMSFTDLNRMYDAFAEVLASNGYECMLYGSTNYLEKVWYDTDTRPVWLAHYADETDYTGPYILWQASCTGEIDGVDGDVDLDILKAQ